MTVVLYGWCRKYPSNMLHWAQKLTDPLRHGFIGGRVTVREIRWRELLYLTVSHSAAGVARGHAQCVCNDWSPSGGPPATFWRIIFTSHCSSFCLGSFLYTPPLTDFHSLCNTSMRGLCYEGLGLKFTCRESYRHRWHSRTVPCFTSRVKVGTGVIDCVSERPRASVSEGGLKKSHTREQVTYPLPSIRQVGLVVWTMW